MKFVRDKRPVIGRSGEELSTGPTVVIVGILGCVALLYMFGQLEQGSTLRSHLPYGNSGWFWVGLVILLALAVALVAIGSTYWELRQAASWSQAPGRIVRSEMVAERQRSGGDAEKIVNAPAIEYEFEAGGRTIRGSRISIGDDSGGEYSEATLARYPKGATVTVFYDPDDPRNCVLERAAPKDLTLAGCLAALGLLALLCVSVYVLAAHGPAFVRSHFPKAGNAEFAVFTFGFGLAALLFFLGMRRIAQQAAGWPTARGTVAHSGVESYRKTENGRTTTLYRPVVEYTYEVRGRSYRSNQIMLMAQTSGMQGYAEKIAGKYPAGSAVTVHYDPANPGNAALENPRGTVWFPLIIAVAAFALSVWQAGLFG